MYAGAFVFCGLAVAGQVGLGASSMVERPSQLVPLRDTNQNKHALAYITSW